MRMLKKMKKYFVWNTYFEEKQDYEDAMQMMLRDSSRTGLLAVKAIMLFEIIMVILWFLQKNSIYDFHSVCYLIAYVFLFLISLITQLQLSGNIAAAGLLTKRAYFFTYFYNIALMIWTLFVTCLDISGSGDFSCVLYMTIVIIIPIVTFISPRFYLTLNIIGSTTVIFFLITYCDISKNRGNLINFTVFALISCIAGCTYSVTRIKNYADRVKLKKVNQELRFIADHDYLSGLYNRQKLGEVSEVIWNRCVTEQKTLSCMLCDFDDFKKFNDQYGHDMGDRCIKAVADIYREVFQETDPYIFRYGGEEFLILFPGREYQYTSKKAEILQEKLKKVTFRGVKDVQGITMSIGIYTDKPRSVQQMNHYFTMADEQMYRAKQAGKNCICGLDACELPDFT